MLVRKLIAAMAVVAIPVALIGSEPSTKARDGATRKTCTINEATGSRLASVRVCRTKAERDAAKAEARQVAERIQNMRADSCPPQC